MAAQGLVARVRSGAKEALRASPAIRGNSVTHRVQTWRAYRNASIDPSLTTRQDWLGRLGQEGIVVAPGYLAAEEAGELLRASEDILAAARNGELPDDTFTNQPKILCRVARADVLVPETRRFFEDADIRSVFEAYISPSVASYRREFDYRYGLQQEDEVRMADLFHFDNWRPICKAFLYLTDVGEENAPFVYLKGSHQRGRWRHKFEREYDAHGPTGRFGHFFPQEMRQLRARHGWTEEVCTAPAGTLILADFRGLHRGTPMVSGRRVLLNNTFDLMNPEAAGQG